MLRVAGLAALLDRRGPKGQRASVTYADLDTVPVDFTVTPAHYLALASSADLIGSANAAGMPILMNSGLLIVRNTAWSRSVLLEAWWRRRAQTPDQLSLWEALFEGWGDAHTFANYAAGHREALLRLLQQRLGGPCAASETCQNILERTGCLAAPLQVGRVLLLPARFAIGSLPPLQADHVHARPWFCHKKCGRVDGGASAPTGGAPTAAARTTRPSRAAATPRRASSAAAPTSSTRTARPSARATASCVPVSSSFVGLFLSCVWPHLPSLGKNAAAE